MDQQIIAAEVAKAEAHFATISADKVRDLGKIAGIVGRQGRRGELECAVAKAIAAAARAELRRRVAH
jgi:hypothetical protein